MRKLLWIAAVPLAAVGVCALDSAGPAAGGALLCVAVGLVVVALTKRAPEKQHAIRLLMESPHEIDRIVIQEGGVAQIVLAQGDRYLALLNIEDKKKFDDALTIVTAHVPNAQIDYRTEFQEFVYRDLKFWNRF